MAYDSSSSSIYGISDEEFRQFVDLDFEDILNTPSSSLDFSSSSSPLNQLDQSDLQDNDLQLFQPQEPSQPQNPSQPTIRTPKPPATGPFTCTHPSCACNQPFKRRSDLKKHIDKHTRPYRCLESGCAVRPFSNNHDLVRHTREVHERSTAGSKAVKIVCPVPSCKRHARGFARKENLALHIKNMHSALEAANHALSGWGSQQQAAEQSTTQPVVQTTTVQATASPAVQPTFPEPHTVGPTALQNSVSPVAALPSPVSTQSWAMGSAAMTSIASPALSSGYGSDITNSSQLLLFGLQSELQGHREELAARLRAVESQLSALQHTISVLGVEGVDF